MLELNDLLRIQDDFTKTLGKSPTNSEVQFALNIEISEFYNTLPWKWWKRNHEVIKEKVLDELADVMAFWLTLFNSYLQANTQTLDQGYAAELYTRDVQSLEHAIMYEIAKQQGNVPKLVDIPYATDAIMTNYTAGGQLLGKLISAAIYHTKATPREIITAYKKKMQTNYDRQKQNY